MARASFVVAVWLLCHAVVSSAQSVPPSEPEAEAADRFARGVELFREGAYRAALVEFQRAYGTAPDHRLLYNIGRTQLKLQDYLGAAESYEGYLREGGVDVPTDRRMQVEEALTELRQRVGGIRLSVARSGLAVLLDDVEVGITPLSSPIRTNVGRHRIVLRADDGATAARTIDVAGGDVVHLEMTLAERSHEVAAMPPERTTWSTKRKIALAGWVTGGLLLAGATVTGVLALHAERDLDQVLATRNYNQAEAEDERAEVRTFALTTDILIGVGAAMVLTGTVLWFVGDEPDEPTSAQARPRIEVGFGPLSGVVTTSF